MNRRLFSAVAFAGTALSLALGSQWSEAQAPAGAAASGANPGSRRLRLNTPNATANRSVRILQALNLTTEQRPKVEAELKSYQDALETLQKNHQAKMSEILTPQQAEMYRTMTSGSAGGRPGFGQNQATGQRGGGGGLGRRTPELTVAAMTTELSLTDEQAKQILAILQASQTEMDNLRTATTADGDRTVMREKMQTLMQARNAKINALLTPEQQAKWQASQQNRRGPGRNTGGSRNQGGL